MSQTIYERLQSVARAQAEGLSLAAFQTDHAALLRSAEETLRKDDLIRSVRASMDADALECAHGFCHCEAVARDAGALVMIEGPPRGVEDRELGGLAVAAQVAGLLHDIKRKEQDHALRGSIEAGRILEKIGMDSTRRGYVTEAIRNHEAFKERLDPGDRAARLVSDALYDADKFRWGPENFTTTLWLMVGANNTPPEELHRTFLQKMKGIERIKETFRTGTGRRYGPEIIDRGIAIGNAIYAEMSALLRSGG